MTQSLQRFGKSISINPRSCQLKLLIFIKQTKETHGLAISFGEQMMIHLKH